MPIFKYMRILCDLPERSKDSRPYFYAALGIFLVLAAFFYSPLGKDWGMYGSADWDFSNCIHAVPAWTVKYFHELPLWNPYLRGGSTQIGNPQNPSPFSLTFLMSLIAGPLAGIKFGNALNAVLGMAGMYFLMGAFDTIWIARVLAAVLLAFNGTVAQHVIQGHFMWLMTMYWPWMLLFFLKGLKDRPWMYLAAGALSLQFWGGGTYPLAFALAILGLLTVLLSLRDKNAGYLLRFAEMMGAFVIFSGPRLFMVMETLYRFPRVTINEDMQIPWGIFYYAFLCQDQIHHHCGIKVDEFSAYVGIVPIVLSVISFFYWKKIWPYLCVLSFSLVMAFGNSPYSPFWPVFHQMGAGYFHFSTRSFLISVFFIALCSGLSLSYLVLYWREKYPAVIPMAVLAVIFVAINLLAVLTPVHRVTETGERQKQDFQSALPFSQLEVTQKERYRFGNSAMLDLILQNTGTANGYDALTTPSHVVPKNSQDYRGEFYLQHSSGSVRVASWSPNKWDVKLQVFQKDVLVVNQNYDPGWRTYPPRKTLNANGVLGVEVTPEDAEMVFYYLPFNFILGCWVSLIGLMAIIWDLRNREKEC
jgi:hypothetical protein